MKGIFKSFGYWMAWNFYKRFLNLVIGLFIGNMVNWKKYINWILNDPVFL